MKYWVVRTFTGAAMVMDSNAAIKFTEEHPGRLIAGPFNTEAEAWARANEYNRTLG